MVQGFRRMLQGLCDGSVLLDPWPMCCTISDVQAQRAHGRAHDWVHVWGCALGCNILPDVLHNLRMQSCTVLSSVCFCWGCNLISQSLCVCVCVFARAPSRTGACACALTGLFGVK